jgi:hypothetical protein
MESSIMTEENPAQATAVASDQMPDQTSAAVVEPPVVPPPVTPPPQKRSGGAMALVGGVVAAVIGFGVAQVVPNGWPMGNVAALETQVAAQAEEIAALKAALAGVVPDAALVERVTALESAPAPDMTALDARLSALEDQIAALPPPGDGADSAALTRLQAEVEALKATGGPLPEALAEMNRALDERLAAAETETQAIIAKVEAAAAAADRRSAIGQIRAALESGAPYASALEGLAAPDLPEVLATGAETGLPTLQSLQASFPDAARSALDAAMRADMGETWTERVGTFLLTQTGARSLAPREGNDPDAVLSRAEAALRAGDLTTTVSELNALPDVALDAMQDWLAQANIRLAAQDAVAALSTTLEQ